ncbi:P-loop containing nucleoside triphosphate hydrolase protein [Guyanagaster necrorhizus]|uniref:P-loop containing nucleoside triphosphate hydrolase protein n=1 Tax=Guyanagaster necrorhizus TaxID=856835 RepID=A0A9P8ATB2_9AGAR|nr:P-loop containing nucleoside triphosphate hydrolase protein [Guyanagaster necrorhizus MCA 3950]KAG7447258.1 P-loop containing nucleoside triphosphate hydrolase protein [Guyanagaster necrorhizus MCA 3950]
MTPDSWPTFPSLGSHISRRFRSGASRRTTIRYTNPSHLSRNALSHAIAPPPPKVDIVSIARRLTPERPEAILQFFEKHVADWAASKRVADRLALFGVPHEHIPTVLLVFTQAVASKKLSTRNGYIDYSLERFGRMSPDDDERQYFDMVYNIVLYTWVSDPSNQAYLESQNIPTSVIHSMRALSDATSRPHPGDHYPFARGLRRKFIMHVGPTNSGKTHHALRALAAAPTGIYAGPLRLLAQEIWERLNLGQIVPAGTEEGHVPEPPSPRADSAFDVSPEKPSLTKLGNPKYARECNMVTGEEVKIVNENASLYSCTVEMIKPNILYDVAVVDEIQMIGDAERGFAWTEAVLGLNAREIHLCGEETAVPIIEAMVKETNDDLVVKRYERLTPLEVEKQSLQGDLSKVRKGDCIVAFSRRSIFQMKRDVEKLGMSCATVYGRLPPEVRSEQADLFNDAGSAFDVLIGSDAIGMGLNLKIRRIIFSDVQKYHQDTVKYLSISATKQIAGRAGRFGLHGSEVPGGLVTTLNEAHLPFLTRTMKLSIPSLKTARITPSYPSLVATVSALPLHSAMNTIYLAHAYTSKLSPTYRYVYGSATRLSTNYLDAYIQGASLTDFDVMLAAPIPWRDQECLSFVERLLTLFSTQGVARLEECMEETPFMSTLEKVENRNVSTNEDLLLLETFHKMLGLYTWLSYRRPVAFPDQSKAAELKPRVQAGIETALDWMSATKRARNNVPRRKVVDYSPVKPTGGARVNKRAKLFAQYTAKYA